MITLFKLFSLCPLWLLHGLGLVLGWAVFLASPVYRQRFLTNAHQARLTWRHWIGAVGEAGKLVSELPRLWMGRSVPVVWDGSEHVEDALRRGRGIVFLTPHLGCFEITAQAYAHSYGQFGKPMTVLYRLPRQVWLQQLVGQSRSKPGLLTAPAILSGVKQMIKALKAGESVGLLPDQVPPQGMGVMAPFFGRDAYTMTLSVRLAQQTGASVLLAWGERLSWGRGFVVHVRPTPAAIPEELDQAVAVVNRMMEELILACPQQYLWGYARYKQPRAST